MKKLSLLLICGCFTALPIFSFAQWTQISSGSFPRIIGNNLIGTTYNDKVTCMTTDASGVIYAGTNENGIWKYDGTIWIPVGGPQNPVLPTILVAGPLTICGPRFAPVQSIAVDGSNNLYVAFNGANGPTTKQTILGNSLPTGVYRWNGTVWSQYNTGIPVLGDDKTPHFYNGLATAGNFVFVSFDNQIYARQISGGVACSCNAGNWCQLTLSYPVSPTLITSLTIKKTSLAPLYDLVIGTDLGIYTFNLGACASGPNCSGPVTDLKFKYSNTTNYMNALNIAVDPSILNTYVIRLFAVGGTTSGGSSGIQLTSVYRYNFGGTVTDGDWQKLDGNIPTFSNNYNINAQLLCWRTLGGSFRTIVSYKNSGVTGPAVARTIDDGTNNGLTWTLPYLPIPSVPITCLVHDNLAAGYIYAGTIDQGVWRVSVAQFKMDGTDLPQEAKDQVSVFPNPFEQTTSFELTIPFDETISVLLYNLNGELISKIVDEESYKAGVYHINYNTSLLTSGVYYYQLVSDKTSITGKIVKN